VLRHEQQICYFLVDELVETLDVVLIDVYFGSGSEETLDLVSALDMLVGLEVVDWLEWIWVLSCHFVPPLENGYSGLENFGGKARQERKASALSD
jgi:hypothetical protein